MKSSSFFFYVRNMTLCLETGGIYSFKSLLKIPILFNILLLPFSSSGIARAFPGRWASYPEDQNEEKIKTIWGKTRKGWGNIISPTHGWEAGYGPGVMALLFCKFMKCNLPGDIFLYFLSNGHFTYMSYGGGILEGAITLIFKGTDHDFCWSGKPIYHLQKQGNIHIFQNKYQNPRKFAEIMKKNRVFGKFLSWGHSNSVFNFLKF